MRKRRSTFTKRFEKQLKKKRKRDPSLADAVIRTVELIIETPSHPGVNLHPIKETNNKIWEAYVTKAIRVTCQFDDGFVIFRNNCRHDIIDRGQW